MKNSLQKAFYLYTIKRYEILAPNIFINWDSEMDFCGIRKNSGFLDEIELKLTKSDFQADFKKTSRVKSKYKCFHSPTYSYEGYYHANKHIAIKNGKTPANYFSFILPEELSKTVVIPEYAGLYTFNKNFRITEVKKAKCLHKRKVSDTVKYKIGRKMTYRYWNALQ